MELGLKLRQFGFRIHAFRSAQVFFPSVQTFQYTPHTTLGKMTNQTP